ncbi:HNH endonuclease [Mucilaginibacter galii]|nr:hypothetical protein [Mucilaginibacter galii]
MEKYRYPALNVTRRISNTLYLSKNTPVQQITEKHEGNVPAHGTYGQLLFDERWRTKRLDILARDRNQCIICNNTQELQVHHRQYHYIKAESQFKPPWDYPENLLITLCKKCHNRGHNKFKVPTLSI